MSPNVELSKIGPIQMVDVERSKNEIHDDYWRTCTVLQGDPLVSDIGDTSPHRLARLYGGTWSRWNHHAVVQVARCPLRCWYCYVDNLEPDTAISVSELVAGYKRLRDYVGDVNVLHFMGGCPGRYANLWPLIRREMDVQGCVGDVFLTDVILVEEHIYNQRPWLRIPRRSLVQVCLKGTNFENFRENTGLWAFGTAMKELGHYLRRQDVYFSMIEESPAGRAFALELFDEEAVDFLRVKEYEVVKRRKKDSHGMGRRQAL